MPLSISPTQDDIFTVLGDFLTSVLGIKVVQGQINRVPEPPDTDFAVMWPLRFPRLATNIDIAVDAVFTGEIAGTLLTISAVNPKFAGKIAVGSTIFGVGLAANTMVTGLGSGTGGVGTYQVAPSQSIASETLAAGTAGLLQKAECVVQIDIHGPNASNNAQIVSTTFRDDYAYEFFAGENPNIAPLYADDPRQVPFVNAEQQYEDRFIIEAHMQVNQTVTVPQQFADVIDVGLINVEATYPAD